MNYPKLDVKKKEGSEKFILKRKELSYSVKDFWQWSTSDLVSNATRGMLAEFIVATALGVDLNRLREEWSTWDLTISENLTVEVKCSGYIQTWSHNKLSNIKFSIKKTQACNEVTGKYEGIKKRHALVYIFALFNPQVQEGIDPLDLDQWVFYVLPTITLNEKMKDKASLSLTELERLCKKVKYDEIHSEVKKISH
jgi:hypothetical protein